MSTSQTPIPHASPALTIGGVTLRTRIVPAPMCNVSDRAFRAITRDMGADLTTTQMVSCEGIVRNDENTWRILDWAGGEAEAPCCVQLLGSDPATLAEAARVLEARGATMIDLNMGCPARKVTGNECGSALMRHPALVARIVRAIAQAVRVPFTVKMRAGYDDGEFSAMELARICQEEGAQAVCLHARTRQQGYRGHADWSLIAELKAALRIPVIGNGDVTSPADAVRMFRETGCDGVMIGRGLIGNPWLLRACETAVNDWFEGRIANESAIPDDHLVEQEDAAVDLEHGATSARPVRVPYYMRDVTVAQRLELVIRHTGMMVDCKGERRGVLEMRKHSLQYIKGMPGCKALRERLMKIETLAEVGAAIDEYRQFLASPRGSNAAGSIGAPEATTAAPTP